MAAPAGLDPPSGTVVGFALSGFQGQGHQQMLRGRRSARVPNPLADADADADADYAGAGPQQRRELRMRPLR